MGLTERKHSIAGMASYGLGKFQAEFFAQAFGVVVFKYYEDEIVNDASWTWLIAVGFIIYSLWNAINDPLIAYLTEKKTTFMTNRFGRRFPWIAIGLILWVFSFVLIFTIPGPFLENYYLIFAWMVITTCLFDTLYSLWDVNYQSVFPDKFRTEKSRNRAAGIATGIGIVGVAAGFILPSILTAAGQPQTFVTTAIVITIVGFFVAFLVLPGVRETPDMTERYLADRENREEDSFFKELKTALKERNFFAWIILYLFYQSAVVCMTGSVLYIGDYAFAGGPASTTIIFVGLLIGALVAVPLWIKLFKKVGQGSNQRMMMITAIIMAFFALFLAIPFVHTELTFTLFVLLFGLGWGGYWMIMTPALADVIDEIVVKTGRRNDGIFMGFRAFFGRLSIAVQAISFWLIHTLTGFDGNLTVQTDLAVFGIHIHTALLPAIFLVAGVLVFWKLNNLNSEKVAKIKTELAELGL